MLTAYHTKYFAHELTKRCPSDSIEKLAGALVDAQVDLNPHQVEAALFAFRSPLSKGALLADEVGLGKTIEAGLVLSQKWAERKRRILVMVPERQDAIHRHISQRNAEFFAIEADKLDAWAEDLKVRLEREIKEFDRQIKEARKAAIAALTLEEKLARKNRSRRSRLTVVENS
jgi:hypothetical protein